MSEPSAELRLAKLGIGNSTTAPPGRIAYPLEQLAVLIGLAVPDWEASVHDDYLCETMLIVSLKPSPPGSPDFLITCEPCGSFGLRMVVGERISLLGHRLPGQEILAMIDARMPRP